MRQLEMTNKLVAAHRGAVSGGAHENTLAAFQRAIEIGCDMIEFDVRRTHDGCLIVHHDDSIAGLAIAARKFGDLRDAARRSGFELARLEEVLELTRGRIDLDVELKEAGYEQEVLAVLHEQADAATLRITSFQCSAIRAVKSLAPDIQAGLLVEDVSPSEMASLYARSTADFLAPRYDLLDAAAKIADGLFVWTVDSDDGLRATLRHPKVAAIITNRSEAALAQRKELFGLSIPTML
jgi:glycerophosphoryl diester phosphodiesterase